MVGCLTGRKPQKWKSLTAKLSCGAGLLVMQAGANMVLASVAGSSVDFARRVLEAGGSHSSLNLGSSMRTRLFMDFTVT